MVTGRGLGGAESTIDRHRYSNYCQENWRGTTRARGDATGLQAAGACGSGPGAAAGARAAPVARRRTPQPPACHCAPATTGDAARACCPTGTCSGRARRARHAAGCCLRTRRLSAPRPAALVAARTPPPPLWGPQLSVNRFNNQDLSKFHDRRYSYSKTESTLYKINV